MEGEEDATDSGSSEEEDAALYAYNSYMKEVIIEITKKAEPSVDINEVMDRIKKVIQVTVDISKAIYTLVDAAENASKAEDRDGNLSDLIYIKINELQKTVDDEIASENPIDVFKRYITLMLDGVPEVQFDLDEEFLLTSNPDILYLKNVIKFIYELKSMHVEAFLWWSVVEDLILYTTSTMRHLYHEYTRAITGVETTQPRPSYCTSSINKLMGYAVSHLVVEKDFIANTKPKVEKMMMNIRMSLNNIIRHR
jgi:predicted metalloendopeptidase